MAGDTPYETTAAGVDPADVQGNILHGYRLRDDGRVRHLVLRVVDSAAARAFLGSLADGKNSAALQVTSDERPDCMSELKAGHCLNVGITFVGLRALGVPEPSLAGFPVEFREGMVARAKKLGDVGPSAPEKWDTHLRDTDRVDVIFTIHAWDRDDIEGPSRQILRTRAFQAVDHFDGAALRDGKIHFGYRDGISRIGFVGIHTGEKARHRRLVPVGAVLLGHPTPFPELRWHVPQPEALGRNGAFNAFRVLAQDVAGFEEFLEKVAKEFPHLTPDWLAAKLCGRWRNGVPLINSPMGPPADPDDKDELDDFDYHEDLDGRVCPIGAHIRRGNPRNALVVQRGANHTRPIVRRGLPYGEAFDPEQPDDVPRGLLGNFICASLAAQFEAVQYDWLNLGLHDPRISGTNDVLSGVIDPTTSRFEIPIHGQRPIVLREIPQFVTTRGGAYTFLPSLTALRWIGQLSSP